jgi:hypothetical protein
LLFSGPWQSLQNFSASFLLLSEYALAWFLSLGIFAVLSSGALSKKMSIPAQMKKKEMLRALIDTLLFIPNLSSD